MNADIEALYQEIGKEALAIVDDLQGKLLVYAEVEDGAVSASLLYEKGAAHTVTFKYCTLQLEDAIYALWEKWPQHPGNKEWATMAYLVRDNKFTIDLAYPDQINPDEGTSDRRPRIIEKYFGSVRVDYSQP